MEVSDSWWMAPAGSAITALVGFLIWTGKILVARWKAADADEAEAIQGLRAMQALYHCMSQVLSSARASRVVLLRASNGGATPRPGTPIVSTAMYEVRSNMPSVAQLWSSRPVDPAYIDILVRLADERRLELVTEDLTIGSQLREVYEGSGVKCSLVFYLYADKRAMYYLSVNFDRVPPNLSAREQMKKRAAVLQLAQIVAESKELRAREWA